MLTDVLPVCESAWQGSFELNVHDWLIPYSVGSGAAPVLLPRSPELEPEPELELKTEPEQQGRSKDP